MVPLLVSWISPKYLLNIYTDVQASGALLLLE